MFVSSIRLLYPNYSMGASLFEGGAAVKFLWNTSVLYCTCKVYILSWDWCQPIIPFSSAHSVDIVEKRQTPPIINSRELCGQTMGFCQFYTHCIEALFPCGHMGFALSYARHRCEAVRQLRVSSENCKTCVQDKQVVKWAQASEKCLQKKLHHLLLNNFTRTRHHNLLQDPPTCLELERRAIEEMDSCYQSESVELCSALERTPDVESFQKDLSTVVGAFHVGGE